MPKAKKYKTLTMIDAVENILSNDPDIATRKIRINSNNPKTVPLKIYKRVSLEYLKIFSCPAISIFSSLNIKFKRDSSAATQRSFDLMIDVCLEHIDLAEAITEAEILAEDIIATLEQNKGLNGTVAECLISEIDEIGRKLDDNNMLRFALRLYFTIKTR